MVLKVSQSTMIMIQRKEDIRQFLKIIIFSYFICSENAFLQCKPNYFYLKI